MQIQALETGYFKLDGGAMFGVVPKSIWHRLHPADENNMCRWSMRSLLIEKGNRLILVDTGIGNKQPDSFFRHFHLHGQDSLLGSIQKVGYQPEDITDVFLTHLHFDHCGGAVVRVGEKLRPLFERARYWSNRAHWQWAVQPNAREKASFLKENILPLEESGQLAFADSPEMLDVQGFTIRYVDGHTEKQMLPQVQMGNQTLVFCGDLIPSAHHLKIPYVMGYDVRPLLTLTEKEELLEVAAAQNWILVFQHDPDTEAARVQKDEKNNFVIVQKGKLSDLLG
jgi:glyoxylase-like metal-dependent hydrolase (beta-lactamase superfamily II)